MSIGRLRSLGSSAKVLGEGAYGRIWRIPVSCVIDRAGRLANNSWDDPQADGLCALPN